MGETEQLLHFKVNGHHFYTAHGRTEGSAVAEHFNGEGRMLISMTVVAIDQYI